MAASRAAHLPHILRASRQVTAAARQNAACRRVFCALIQLDMPETFELIQNKLCLILMSIFFLFLSDQHQRKTTHAFMLHHT